MVSLRTNEAALEGLKSVRTAHQFLDRAQREVSSGLRVGTASDNAAYWSIATTMRSDVGAISATQDALELGAALVDVTYTGMTATIAVMEEVKVKLILAREPGVDKSKINKEIEQLRAQVYSIIDSSSFAGQNWLHRYTDDDDADQQIVGSFTRNGIGVGVDTLAFTRAMPLGTNHLIDEVYHNGILTNVEYARQLRTETEWTFINGRQHDIHPVFALNAATTATDIDGMIAVTDRMIGDMVDAATQLGALSRRIAMQSAFAAGMNDTMTKGSDGWSMPT